MKTRCEWYLSDGTILKGKEASDHLKSKLENYEKVIADVDRILSRSLKNNHIVDYSYLHMKLYLTEIPQHPALLYPELPDIFLPHLRL